MFLGRGWSRSRSRYEAATTVTVNLTPRSGSSTSLEGDARGERQEFPLERVGMTVALRRYLRKPIRRNGRNGGYGAREIFTGEEHEESSNMSRNTDSIRGVSDRAFL